MRVFVLVRAVPELIYCVGGWAAFEFFGKALSRFAIQWPDNVKMNKLSRI